MHNIHRYLSMKNYEIEQSLPKLIKKRQVAQESYISYERVGCFYHHFYQHCSFPYIFLLITSIALVGTHEHIEKEPRSKITVCEILIALENGQKLM